MQKLLDETSKEIDLNVEKYAEFLDGLEMKSFEVYPINNMENTQGIIIDVNSRSRNIWKNAYLQFYIDFDFFNNSATNLC